MVLNEELAGENRYQRITGRSAVQADFLDGHPSPYCAGHNVVGLLGLQRCAV